MQDRAKYIEEILEALWTDSEENGGKDKDSLSSPHAEEPLLKDPAMVEALRECEETGLVSSGGQSLHLTEPGRARARDVVRRHRLAERLLHDVLALGAEETESSACEFEHMLSADAANSICILLGHPTVCPHGKPIPPGECCRKGVEESRPLVMPATWLRTGEEATIAYLGVRAGDRLDQLAALGLLPGTRVSLLQRVPSHMLKFGETQLALDEGILKEIYVRRPAAQRPPEKAAGRHHFPWRRG